MHHGALVHPATDKIHQHGYEYDDAEDAAGAQSLDFGLDAAAGVRGPALEEVDAFVHGGDEGDAGFGDGSGLLAEQGDDCGLAALGVFLGVSVFLSVVVVVVGGGAVEERARAGGLGGAEGAAGVV
jgi:hypothetical protein